MRRRRTASPRGHAIIAVACALLLAACAGGPGPGDRGRLRPVAEPSRVVAAQLAFIRVARTGDWDEWADRAGNGAIIYTPEPVAPRDWVRRDPAPPPATGARRIGEVWSSCDGSLAVVRSAADDQGSSDVTVWRRDRRGGYRWIVSAELNGAVPADAGTAGGDGIAGIDATTAECPASASGSPRPPSGADRQASIAGPPEQRLIDAADGSLTVQSGYSPGRATMLLVSLRQAGETEVVISQNAIPSPF